MAWECYWTLSPEQFRAQLLKAIKGPGMCEGMKGRSSLQPHSLVEESGHQPRNRGKLESNSSTTLEWSPLEGEEIAP